MLGVNVRRFYQYFGKPFLWKPRASRKAGDCAQNCIFESHNATTFRTKGCNQLTVEYRCNYDDQCDDRRELFNGVDVRGGVQGLNPYDECNRCKVVSRNQKHQKFKKISSGFKDIGFKWLFSGIASSASCVDP